MSEPAAVVRPVDWGLTHGRDRALDDEIVSLVRAGERVLDLGCGRGDLLLRLRMEKGILERGIERDGGAVAEAIARGLAVVEGELGEWVGDMPAGSYDLVVLNQVLPLMEDPVAVIEGALRVGRRVAVSYPNFAHWRIRVTLALGGRLPVNPALPYQWYDTPNIRLVTVADFRRLCCERGWCVVYEAFVSQQGPDRAAPVRALPNLRASRALAGLEKSSAWRPTPVFSGRPSRRFSQRVFRAFSLSLLLVSAVFISFFLYIQRERMESELVDRGRMHAVFLAARIESATLSGAAAPLQAALDAAGELPEVRAAAVFTLEGTLVAVSAKDPMLEPVASARTSSETELFNSRRLLAGCVGLKQEGRFDVFCLLNTRDLMALARRVGTTTTAPIGVVRLSLDRGSMERDLGRMLLRSVPLAIAILMLGTGGAFFLSRRVTEPLEQLTEAVRAFGAGNAIREIPRTSDDEIGKLAAAFTNMIRDLSEREREKERLAERLRQAQSMEAVGTISQGISHDFKNILSTLKTAVHILQKGSPGNEFVMKYTGKMQTSLDRGRDLVERLVAFSPKRRIQVGVLDLNALFARLTPMLRLAAGEFVRLNVESPGVPVQVTGDAASLEQMMMNLAYNARDAMPEGGFLGMRLETMDGATDGEPGSARITVRDTGVGMSPEVRQRLFEPYFSTKDAGAGMGLGLSIVHNIVEQHHGRVEVESELGKGTIFRIELPLIAERDAGRQGGEGSA